MRRSTVVRAEAASAAEAVGTGFRGPNPRGDRTLDRSVEKGTRKLYGSVVIWATRLADFAIAAAPQRVRQPCDDCRHGKQIEGPGERLERLEQCGGESRIPRDWVGDERHDRADAERGTDQHRVDVKHPVGEARRLSSG